MDVNGCHVVSEPAQTPEGWSSTVTKEGVLKGPFATLGEAILCAMTWPQGQDSTTTNPAHSESTTDQRKPKS